MNLKRDPERVPNCEGEEGRRGSEGEKETEREVGGVVEKQRLGGKKSLMGLWDNAQGSQIYVTGVTV